MSWLVRDLLDDKILAPHSYLQPNRLVPLLIHPLYSMIIFRSQRKTLGERIEDELVRVDCAHILERENQLFIERTCSFSLLYHSHHVYILEKKFLPSLPIPFFSVRELLVAGNLWRFKPQIQVSLGD